MADTAPVMIPRVAGTDKLCTFFNTGWLTFRGRAMAQELGDRWAEGVHPADLDRCRATFAAFFHARISLPMESFPLRRWWYR